MTPNNFKLPPVENHPAKEVVVVPADKKTTWISRHVKWLNEERHGIKKVGFTAFSVMEKFVLAVSVVGWGLLRKEIRETRRQQSQDAYFKEATPEKSPPKEASIELKSKTRSFNHVQEFAIENGLLWCRTRHSKDDWKPVYFDGHMEGRIPVELNCDGSNLIVLDDTHEVHYKKVLRELRPGIDKEVVEEKHDWLESKGVNLESTHYIAVDKGDRDNWRDKWFSLPFVNGIVNLFTGKRLKLPPDIKTWAIAQRGRYNSYLEDQKGHKHHADVGVTTLYVLDKNGKDIFKFDPWSPKHVRVNLPLPESADASFEAENISVSASVIMAIGYEVKESEPETRTLQIYTKLADIDSEGWNPGLRYDYFDHPDAEEKDIIIMPLPQWIQHPLNLEPGDFVTKEITVVQTGEGNHARELRLEGQHGGQPGFFYKMVNDKEWKFEPFDENTKKNLENSRLEPVVASAKQFETSVHNYQTTTATMPGKALHTLSARLENFGDRSYHSTVHLRIGNNTYELEIHRKKTLKNFIGFKGDSYDLVIPKKYHQNFNLMDAFGHKKVIPLNIKEKDDHVIITNKGTPLFYFDFQRAKTV